MSYSLNTASDGLDLFTIDSRTGVISVQGVLDAEGTTMYTLVVEAVDTNQDVLR